MVTHLLDTDIYTLSRRGHPVVVARLAVAPPPSVAVSVITVEEQVGGWYTALRKAVQPAHVERVYQELADAVRDLGRCPIAPFSVSAIARFDLLLRSKLNVRKNDLRIAAIALEVGAVVVTRNLRDFTRVPGLVCEDWSVPAGP